MMHGFRLQRTGQRVLDDLLGNFWVKYNLEDFSAAVALYQEALKILSVKFASMQIWLLWPDHYKKDIFQTP